MFKLRVPTVQPDIVKDNPQLHTKVATPVDSEIGPVKLPKFADRIKITKASLIKTDQTVEKLNFEVNLKKSRAVVFRRE